MAKLDLQLQLPGAGITTTLNTALDIGVFHIFWGGEGGPKSGQTDLVSRFPPMKKNLVVDLKKILRCYSLLLL